MCAGARGESRRDFTGRQKVRRREFWGLETWHVARRLRSRRNVGHVAKAHEPSVLLPSCENREPETTGQKAKGPRLFSAPSGQLGLETTRKFLRLGCGLAAQAKM